MLIAELTGYPDRFMVSDSQKRERNTLTNLRNRWTQIFPPFLLVLGLISPAMAGAMDELERSTIKGTVLDESTQSPLPAATVMIESTSLGAAADMEGHFFIERVPPGIYNLRFTMMGYETQMINNVVVNPGRTTWLTVELKSTVLEMEGITVTAGFFQEAKDAVVSNRSMDYEEIRMDPGSVADIQRVVQALPSVVSGSDQDNEIIVRGGMPGENLFILDHIEISNPNHFGHQGLGGGPMNMINTEFVRRIDFYAGAFPARYGDKASSVMDISLREGDRERATGTAELGMSGAGAMVEGPIASGRGAYILSARKSYLDLIISQTGLTAVPKYYNLQGKITYDLNPSNQLIWNGIYGNDHIKIEDGEDDEDTDNFRSDSDQYAMGMTLRTLYGDRGFSRITISQVGNHWDQVAWDRLGKRFYENLSTEVERTLKADLNYQISKNLEFSMGGQIKSIPFNINIWGDSDTLFVYQPGTTHILADSIVYPEYRRKNKETTLKSAAFAQMKISPLSRIEMTFGIRTDYFEYTGRQTVDPRAGISFHLSEKTDFNLAVGQFSQSPAYVQITDHPDNRNLRFKQNRQTVGGISRLFSEDMRGTLEFFYKDYDNVPIPKDALTPNPFDLSQGQLVNYGKGYAKGFELFVQKKLVQTYHFTMSYAYSISKGTDPRYGSEYNWDYDYRHNFTLIGGAHYDLREMKWYNAMKKSSLYRYLKWLTPLADQMDLGIRWRYLGGRPYTKRTYLPQYRRWILDPEDPVNGQRYSAYHRLDLRVDWRTMFSRWNMVVYLDIMNIYGRDNIWEYDYKSDGSIEKILQFQTFPVLGFVVEL